jgi:hypothetical protein
MSFLVHDFSVKNLFSSFSITSLTLTHSLSDVSFTSCFNAVLIYFPLGKDARETEWGSTIKAHNWLWVNFFLIFIPQHVYAHIKASPHSYTHMHSLTKTTTNRQPRVYFMPRFSLCFEGVFGGKNLHIFSALPINLNEQNLFWHFSPFFHVFKVKVTFKVVVATVADIWKFLW